MLTDVVPEAERQQSLTDGVDGDRRLQLMEAVDRINRRHGRHRIATRPVSTR